MWSLERKPHTLDFYIRRVFRIDPLALLAIAVALLFHAPVSGSPTNFFYAAHVDIHGIIANVLLLQDFRGPVIESVMWTLPLEVQMYVLLPMLFFFIRQNFSLWPLFVIWSLGAAYCFYNFAPNNNTLVVAALYFMPGVMAYVGFAHRKPRLPASLLLPFCAGLLIAFILHPTFRKGWFVCLALGLLLPSFRQIRSKWLIRSSHEVAKYSYGIYLAHPFALVLSIYLMPKVPLALQLTVETLAIIVMSVGAYHLLEKPMIKLGSKLAARAEKRYEQVTLDSERVEQYS